MKSGRGNPWWAPILALAAGSFWAPRPWRIGLIVAFGLAVVAAVRRQERSRTVRTLRRHRHRLANQLQIVSGWLELGQEGRSTEFLERLVQALAAEGLRDAKLLPSWVYLIWEVEGMAEVKGVACVWEGLAEIRFRLPWERWIFRRAVFAALRVAQATVHIRFYAKGFCITLPQPVRSPEMLELGIKILRGVDTFYLIRGNLTSDILQRDASVRL